MGITFLFWITLYIYVPTLPTYLKARSINLTNIGLILSMYGFTMALFRLPVGSAIDLTGRVKPILISGLVCGAIGAFLIGKGNTTSSIAVGRALTGLSATAWVPLLVIFSSFFMPGEAVYSSTLLTLTASSARMTATSLTGFLNRMGGPRLSFNIACGTGLLAGSIVFFSKETYKTERRISLYEMAGLFIRKNLLVPAFISILVHYADWSVTFGFLPILAQDLGATDIMKSALISLNIAALTAANLLNTFLLKRIKHTTILFIGTFVLFSGILVIVFSKSLGCIFAGTMLMGFAFGMMYPILLGMSIQNVDKNQRNTAMGIHQALYSLGMFLGPWMSGFIASLINIRGAFLVTGVIFFVFTNLLLIVFIRNTTRGRITAAPAATE